VKPAGMNHRVTRDGFTAEGAEGAERKRRGKKLK
jgi:hypothetical protein